MPEPIKGLKLALLTLGLGLGTFIQILDLSITNVSIPHIAGDLGTSSNNGTWVITSFAISNGILLLLTGWLARKFGEVHVFAWSCALFSVISLLCGLARSFPMLVFLRVLQGAAGGALIPLSQSLILGNYPENKKGFGLGLWAMIVIVAPILGPILGGWITDNYGWPWIFYINVPIGFISAILVIFLLDNEYHEERKRTNGTPFDWIGFLLVCIFVGCLQVALDKGNELDWFESDFIRFMSVTSCLALLYGLIWEASTPHPLVDLSILKERNFAIATIAAACTFFIFYGAFVLVPLWLQLQQGYTAYKAGLVLSGTGIVSIFITPLVGIYLHKLDLRIWATLSFLIFSATFFWAAMFTTQVDFNTIFFQRLFQGIGISLFFVPLSALALQELPAEEVSAASGVFNFFRMIAGGGFGTSLFITLWTRREARYHTYLTENIYENNPQVIDAIDRLKEFDLTDQQSFNVLRDLINQESFMLSINDAFYLSAWLFFIIIAIVWFAKPKKEKSVRTNHEVFKDSFA